VKNPNSPKCHLNLRNHLDFQELLKMEGSKLWSLQRDSLLEEMTENPKQAEQLNELESYQMLNAR
jgi:hypothetical protein